MDERPLNVVSLSRKEFDNQRVKPDNYLFFVYEEYVSEDGKAKTKISLYKGSLLVCGDLYEAVINLNKEVEKLKVSGGGGKSDLEIGIITNYNESFPKAEIVYDEDTGKSKLNIRFPLRYETFLGTPYNNYKKIKGWSLNAFNLYPNEIHDKLQAVGFNPITQIISPETFNNSHDAIYSKKCLVFIEDSSPLSDKFSVRSKVYMPFLYILGYGETMAVDYHRGGNYVYPIVRGGRKYLPNRDGLNINNMYKDFYIEGDLLKSGIDLFDDYSNINPDIDYTRNYGYAGPEEFDLGDTSSLILKGETGVVHFVLKDGIKYDTLNRFYILFSGSIPYKIEFKGELNGQEYVIFSIDNDKYVEGIEFSTYGIRGYNDLGLHGVLSLDTLVFAKDMPDLNYSPQSITKISFHYKANASGVKTIFPKFQLYRGSILEQYSIFN